MKINMAYGSGGKQTNELIHSIFEKNFSNPILNKMEDAAILPPLGKLAFTTDSFVVTPMFFAGGDIGKLSICGTVNDLSVMGADPKYLTAGFIIEEGADTNELEKITVSMKQAAKEAGVKIVAGDTKVVEGKGNIYINTAGVGSVLKNGISISNCQDGDVIILSGNLGEHHAAILSSRMEIQNEIYSDCAPLNKMIKPLLTENCQIHCMRDVTRGGLATVLNEMCEQSECRIQIHEEGIPVSDEVTGFCSILGLDPLYMANEGKIVLSVSKKHKDKVLSILRKNKYGKNATVIGEVSKSVSNKNLVTLDTKLGGMRIIDSLTGEGLPRIC